VCYDIRYALRLCQERNLTEACVQLSALLGLWESAVDLALTIDVKLAQQTANLPQNDPELRKKLWLKIGKFFLYCLCMHCLEYQERKYGHVSSCLPSSS
jgi:hypothetical protein